MKDLNIIINYRIKMDNKGRRFFFGKYKGRYINDVIVNDTQYITWSMKNINWFWYNHDEVELYKKQIKKGIKPKNQYELIMESMRQNGNITENQR